LLNGKNIFSDVMINSQTKNQLEETTASTYYDVVAGNLDKCNVSVSPPMTLRYEHLRWPENEMAIFKLEASQNESGLVISGADKIYNYLEVLRHIKYVHRNAEDLNSRTFKLQCSELNGRFHSNIFTVKINVVHEIHINNRIQPFHISDNQLNAIAQDSYLDSSINEKIGAGSIAVSSNAMGVSIIVVVCVGFLAFMIILGVIRIRAAHQRSQSNMDEKAEMEWDNSALTITVNPMDQEVIFSEEAELRGDDSETDEDDEEDDDDDDDEDDDDEGSDLLQDDIESSEEEQEQATVKNRDLEWDDSTLTF